MIRTGLQESGIHFESLLGTAIRNTLAIYIQHKSPRSLLLTFRRRRMCRTIPTIRMRRILRRRVVSSWGACRSRNGRPSLDFLIPQEGLTSLVLLKKGKVHYRTTELVQVPYGLVALPEKGFYGREDGLLVPRYAGLTLLSKYTRDLELRKVKERTLYHAYFLHRRSSGSIG